MGGGGGNFTGGLEKVIQQIQLNHIEQLTMLKEFLSEKGPSELEWETAQISAKTAAIAKKVVDASLLNSDDFKESIQTFSKVSDQFLNVGVDELFQAILRLEKHSSEIAEDLSEFVEVMEDFPEELRKEMQTMFDPFFENLKDLLTQVIDLYGTPDQPGSVSERFLTDEELTRPLRMGGGLEIPLEIDGAPIGEALGDIFERTIIDADRRDDLQPVSEIDIAQIVGETIQRTPIGADQQGDFIPDLQRSLMPDPQLIAETMAMAMPQEITAVIPGEVESISVSGKNVSVSGDSVSVSGGSLGQEQPPIPGETPTIEIDITQLPPTDNNLLEQEDRIRRLVETRDFL